MRPCGGIYVPRSFSSSFSSSSPYPISKLLLNNKKSGIRQFYNAKIRSNYPTKRHQYHYHPSKGRMRRDDRESPDFYYPFYGTLERRHQEDGDDQRDVAPGDEPGYFFRLVLVLLVSHLNTTPPTLCEEDEQHTHTLSFGQNKIKQEHNKKRRERL